MYNNDVLRPTFGGQSFFNSAACGLGQTPAFGFMNHVPAYGFNQGFSPVYGNGVPAFGFGMNAPMVGHGFAAPSMYGAVAPYGWNTMPGIENGMIQHRVDALSGQIAQLTELVCRTALGAQQIQGLPQANMQGTVGFASGRVRESDSHLFWEVAFPGLSMGDLDIEVNGNRVICRTRIPLRNQLRAVGSMELPRGLEIFELPDGRIELNWLVPVSFVGKDVEASWKDGWIQICIPKTELGHRQSVKITTDSPSNGVRKNGARDMTA